LLGLTQEKEKGLRFNGPEEYRRPDKASACRPARAEKGRLGLA
jgi:hypothetical protein